MHPAKSVILFTVLSGLGYGIVNIFLLSLLSGHSPSSVFVLGVIIGLVLVSIGLLSSVFHLGRPERAWRALSQWRTSWLSREGVFALLSFICPLILLSAIVLPELLSPQWHKPLASIGIIINIATLYCTAMIYASLKPIPAWHNYYTPLLYELLSLASGCGFVLALLAIFNLYAIFLIYLSLLLLGLSLWVKLRYWRFVKRHSVSTSSTATGLKGSVKLFEKPHSSANYLMREMVFEVARIHAKKLKIAAIISAFIVPIIALLTLLLFNPPQPLPLITLSSLAFIVSISGIFIERWLFFAEAKHVVSLYYGRQRV